MKGYIIVVLGCDIVLHGASVASLDVKAVYLFFKALVFHMLLIN